MRDVSWLFLGLALADVAAATALTYVLIDLSTASTGLQGSAPPTPSTTWVTYFSTFMAVDAALLVTVGVVSVGIASRIRRWTPAARLILMPVFVLLVVYLFFALLENAVAIQVAGWASQEYLTKVSNTDIYALLYGMFLIAGSVIFGFMDSPRRGNG